MMFLLGLDLPGAEKAADYVIFVGLNPTAQHEGRAHAIVHAQPERIEIIADGRRTALPLRELSAVDTTPEPKISGMLIELTDVRTRRGFTGRDPDFVQDHQQLLLDTLASQQQTLAINDWKAAYSNARMVEAAAARGAATPKDVMNAQASSAQALGNLDAAIASGAYHRNTDVGSGSDATTDRFDALRFSARVSAPRRIENAYGMLRVLLRDPGNPDAPISMVRFLNLPALGPEPREVRASLGGLPPGFSVDQCQLHVFADGSEIATSASPNRLEVTRDEAHQFLLLRYLTTQKSATVPPAVIPELLSSDLAGLVPAAQRSLTIDFAIDRDGRVTNLKTPAGVALDPKLEELLRSLCFYPALTSGTPVDSSGTFALSELIR